jgi:hypothetical protein
MALIASSQQSAIIKPSCRRAFRSGVHDNVRHCVNGFREKIDQLNPTCSVKALH